MQPGNRPTGGFGRLLQDILNEMFDTSTRPPYGSDEMSPEQRERQRELRRAQRRQEREESPRPEAGEEEQLYVTLEQRGLDREDEQAERQRRSRGPVAARTPSLRNDVRASLSSRRSIRRAIVVSEILGPPKGLKKSQDI